MRLQARAWLWIAIGLAAVLRLPTLDVQSLWSDEAVTASVSGGSLGHVMRSVWDGESTPPLFYLLEWPVLKLFGDGEVALRLLPALFSILTVPVVWAIALRAARFLRAGANEKKLPPDSVAAAGAVAAVLCATNPLLIWFGQEARAYSLLGFLAAASVLLLLRALEVPSPKRLVAWVVVAALVVFAHWFAIFLLVGECVWLVIALRRRALWPIVAFGLAICAGLPLLLHQRDNDLASFIGDSSLANRIAELPKQFLVGYDAPLELAGAVLAALLAGLAIVGFLIRARTFEARAIVAIAAAPVVLAVVAAAAGQDYVLTRNLLPALVVTLPIVGAGFAVLGRWGLVTAVALVVLWVGIAVAVVADSSYQRDDWRAAVEAIGPRAGQRLVIVAPGSGTPAVEYYLRRSRRLHGSANVAQIAVVSVSARAPGGERKPRALPGPPSELLVTKTGSTWQAHHVRVPATGTRADGQLVSAYGGPQAVGLLQD